MVGRVSEILEVQMLRREHVVSVVRVMIAHVVLPAFDEHDAVTLTALSAHCMCLHLESTHIALMLHEREVGGHVVTLRMC